MSRVGKLPVELGSGVSFQEKDLEVSIKGPKGELSKKFSGNIKISEADSKITVEPTGDDTFSRAMWGTARSIISNMVQGVTKGFTQDIEIKGVGYKAFVSSGYLSMALGKSHNTQIEIPKEIDVKVDNKGQISLSSIDKELLGQFTATIIAQRPPEPYKGKGIMKKGQYVQRKEGKKK